MKRLSQKEKIDQLVTVMTVWCRFRINLPRHVMTECRSDLDVEAIAVRAQRHFVGHKGTTVEVRNADRPGFHLSLSGNTAHSPQWILYVRDDWFPMAMPRLLRELAHCLVFPDEPTYGWTFVTRYGHLLAYFLGPAAKLSFNSACRQLKIARRKPHTKALTPEQREEIRKRMKAIRATRRGEG